MLFRRHVSRIPFHHQHETFLLLPLLKVTVVPCYPHFLQRDLPFGHTIPSKRGRDTEILLRLFLRQVEEKHRNQGFKTCLLRPVRAGF